MIPTTYFNKEASIRFDVDIEDSVFMKDEAYSYREGYDYAYEYHIVHVKDTLWKNFIVDAITSNDLQYEKELGMYTIFIQENWVLIQKNQTFLMMRANEYEAFTLQQLDVIFARI